MHAANHVKQLNPHDNIYGDTWVQQTIQHDTKTTQDIDTHCYMPPLPVCLSLPIGSTTHSGNLNWNRGSE